MIAVIAAVASAHAEPVVVAVDVDRCADVTLDELLRVVALELDQPTVIAGTSATAATQVVVACADEDFVLRVDDRLTGKVLERRGAVAHDDAPMRPRILGLAIAELVAAGWLEAPRATTSATPARRRSAVAALRRARARPAHARSLALRLGERAQGDGAWLHTAALGASWRGRRLAAAVDGQLALGEHAVPDGRVAITMPSLGAWLGAAWTVASVELAIGASGRVGLAHLAGRSDVRAPERAFWAPVVTAGATGIARAHATTRLSFALAIEGGATVAGVDVIAAGARIAVLRGPMLTITTGVGVAF